MHVPRSMLTRALICALFVAEGAYAQPSLNFKRIDVRWPKVVLGLSVECDGMPTFDMLKQDFRISENGKEVHNFRLSCPDSLVRCPISAALVFDNSGSMTGQPIIDARNAGHTFVLNLDGANDEACIISFDKNVTVLQEITSDVPLLRSAIQNITAGGSTALWSGVYAGVQKIATDGVNPCRAVVVLSDGMDNASIHTPADVIALARANAIPVFTIGLGASVDSTNLRRLADSTGGRAYFVANSSVLERVYQTIARVLIQGSFECEIEYTGDCIGDTVRTVSLTLDSYCGGSDAKTRGFAAPFSAGVTLPIIIRPIPAAAAAGMRFAAQIVLEAPPMGMLFPPADGEFRYDTTCVRFEGLRVPPGSVLGNAPITAWTLPGGVVRFRVEGTHIVTGGGLLLEADFAAGDPRDTTCCPLAFTRWIFDEGCFIPTVASADLCIFPCALAPGITALGPTVFCEGDTLTMLADTAFTSYEWFRDGAPYSSGRHIVRVTESGDYTVRVRDALGCEATSAPLPVRVTVDRRYAFSSPKLAVVSTSSMAGIPIAVEPPLPPGVPVAAAFTVTHNPALLTLESVARADGVSWIDTLEVTSAGGTTRVRFTGTPADSIRPLVQLRYRPIGQSLSAVSTVVGYPAPSFDLSLPCAAWTDPQGTEVLIEGACEKIVRGPAPSRVRIAHHPNPVTATAELQVTLPAFGRLDLQLTDALGQHRMMLAEGEFPPGTHRFHIDAASLPAGVYYVRSLFDGAVEMHPVVKVK